MSKYTTEQVEVLSERDWLAKDVRKALRDYAALLREHESARAAVTDEMRAKACAAYTVAMNGYGSKLQNHSAHEVAMRAALEVVAPMLASARVPDGFAEKLNARLETLEVPESLSPSKAEYWKSGARRVIREVNAMLAAAPKRGEG